MTGASIDASLDAQVRAAAEAARSHEVPFSPPVEVLAAESGGMEEAAPGGMGMDSMPFVVPSAPYVPPRSPFRLVFGFGSDGRYVDAEVKDPVFLWTGSGGTSVKTAAVDGRIAVAGTETKVYLCVCCSRAGEYKSAKVATAEQADRGDDVWTNVELYEIDASEGVKRDYRHAWITVGGGGSRHNPEPFDLVVTESDGAVQYEVDGGSFYFDGVQHDVSGLPAGSITGSGEEHVYLVCTGTKAEPAEEGEEPAEEGEEPAYEWTFELATEEGSPSGSDEKVMNVKLYDLVDGAVAMDYRGVNLPVCSGGVSAARVNALPSVYELVEGENGIRHFANRYFEVSGVLREGHDVSLTPEDVDCFLALRVDSYGSDSLRKYPDLESLQSDMGSQRFAVMPLYKLGLDGAVECDLRHVPRADMWSLRLSSNTRGSGEVV